MVIAGMAIQMNQINRDEILLIFAHPPKLFGDVVGFRPVAFGASGQRFEFHHKSEGGTTNLTLQGWLLERNTLPPDQIKFLGFEILTEEKYVSVRVPAALQKLKAAGVEALPIPRVGERCEFELTTSDGTKVRSQELRGRVILPDFWASWCPPCLAEMPKLKERYRDLHRRGFEIVGLNLDHTLADAKRAIVKQALPWPNVAGPVDDGHRVLWRLEVRAVLKKYERFLL